MARYELRIRDPRTLEVLAMVPKYKGVTWTRRDLEQGRFQLDVEQDQLNDEDAIACDNILEVVRDGAHEFAGVFEKREWQSADRSWVITGGDLKSFHLSHREIDPGVSEFDAQTGVVAETAMIHYVTDHLTAPSDSARKLDNELTSPVVATCRATASAGDSVDFNARWDNLFDLLVAIGESGDVWHDLVVAPDWTGLEYQVYSHADLTRDGAAANPVVFSIQWDNIGKSTFIEDCTRIANVVYVLGDGSGAARNISEIEDTPSVTAHFRREAHIDGRQADSAGKRTEQGNLAIARTLADSKTAKMEPLTIANDQYRSEWDLGDEVTVDFADIGEELDKRIKEVKVTVARQQEKVEVSLGQSPKTLSRLVGEVTARSNRAQQV